MIQEFLSNNLYILTEVFLWFSVISFVILFIALIKSIWGVYYDKRNI